MKVKIFHSVLAAAFSAAVLFILNKYYFKISTEYTVTTLIITVISILGISSNSIDRKNIIINIVGSILISVIVPVIFRWLG